MSNVGIVAPRGSLSLMRIPRWPGQPSTLDVIRHGLPKRGLPAGVAAWRMRNIPNLWRGLWRVKLAALASKITHCPAAYGVLYLDILHADGTRTPLGLASMRVVTDAGVGYLVDALQNLVEPENLKFHGFGTGTTAEAASRRPRW
jgi:hypothetical protein